MVEELALDVSVIGGGAAGLAAAAKAAELGAEKVAIFDNPPFFGRALGGILPQCIHPGFGLHYFKEDLTGPEFATKLVDRVAKQGVEVLLETHVLELRPRGRGVEVVACSPRGLVRAFCRTIVYAAGARERTVFEIGVLGSRPAGVYTAGEAQAMMDLYGILPGRRVVVVGSGDVGLIMARRFALEGAEVKAVVEIMPWPGGLMRNVVQCLEDFGIPLLLGHAVTRVLGSRRVEGVEVAPVDERLRPVPEGRQIIECDTVIVAAGLIPRVELLRRAGAEIDSSTGGPVANDYLETSLANVFVAGNSLVINDLVDHAAEQGEWAAASAVQALKEGGVPHGGVKHVSNGDNVRLAVPQLLTATRDVTLYVRAKRPMDNAKLVIPEVGKEVKLPRVRPAEMIKVSLKLDEVLNAEGGRITVSIVPG